MAKKAEVDLNQLLALRIKQGYSVSDMATRLGYKTPTGYWLLEKGKRQISVDNLYCLAQIYSIPMEDLVQEV